MTTFCKTRNSVVKQLIDSESDEDARRKLQNGFIPESRKKEYDKLMAEQPKQTEEDGFKDITSYSSWFALHPEKVAGIAEGSSSLFFPVKIKGTKEDVDRMFSNRAQRSGHDAILHKKTKLERIAQQLINYL